MYDATKRFAVLAMPFRASLPVYLEFREWSGLHPNDFLCRRCLRLDLRSRLREKSQHFALEEWELSSRVMTLRGMIQLGGGLALCVRDRFGHSPLNV
ncbi:hypothetical protein NPIL_83591 [Nephila pilipes]|uniref:Uncharacterized protein n=1 Tax=Nephila pilipes TaxID=299642 RepID=A0A8X6P0L3_NEPPI|nr:hypothetical protein NPIL_83591 [Nephila pilipes]